ncbi:hypothetical protein [Teichococcus vastitatis]|uniref:hypothetical protein n=1 Tax=Teichococcus vastitatis TaxID=2307076 RepID=UPI000E76B0EE|nr:hypothetical protein [Pseudoroseomonas vastitatis]
MFVLPFSAFGQGPGGDICRRLGIQIETCRSWNDLTLAALRRNRDGALVEEAARLGRILAPGERVVLHALLHALDFDAVADDLAGGRTWWRMSIVGGPHRDAVLACLVRRDDPLSSNDEEIPW